MKRYLAREVLHYNIEELLAIPERDVVVVFDDGEVVSFGQALIFSSFCWEAVRRFPETPLLKSFICTEELLSKGSHSTIASNVNKTCFMKYRSMGVEIHMNELRKIAFDVMNNITNFVATELEADMSSICALDLLEVMYHPEIYAANEHIKTLTKVTKTHTDACNAIAERVLLHDESLKYNNIAKGARSGIIRLNQVIQCVSSRGCVSDIDSSIFPNPIRQGYAEGFTSLADSQEDSRSAARSLLMQKGAMRDAEYTNRQVQLTATAIKKVIHGDCGSTKYMTVTLNSRRKLYDMEGIFFIDETNGVLRPLSRADTHLVHTAIKIRSVFGCLHKDNENVCATCYSEVSYSVPDNANIGYLAAVYVQSPAGQLILSNKHYEGSAGVIDAVFSEDAQQYIYLGEETNDLYFTRALHGLNFSITIDADEMRNISDIYTCEDINNISITRVSAMRCIQIDHAVQGSDRTVSCVLGVNCGSRLASLSKEALTYIRDKGYRITEKGEYVVDMSDWDISQPFSKLPMKNFSTEEYAKAIETFYMGGKSIKGGGVKGIKSVMKYDTPDEAVDAFHELVSMKLSVHHIHLQILVLSTMSVSENDKNYNVPHERDKGVSCHYNDVVKYRGLGVAMAHERQAAICLSLSSFLLKNRPSNPLEDLLLE